MFTIKAFKIDADEKVQINMYEARSLDVLRNVEGGKSGEHAVVFRDDNDDEMYIPVTNDLPKTSEQVVCRKVYIENRYGKTTEVVKAENVPE